MKFIKITFLIVVLLVGCEQTVTPEKAINQPLYASFELGVNYNDYVMMTFLEANPKVYQVLYTHKVDYMIPQVFYFIPQTLELDTKDKWDRYFEDWSKALEESDFNYIESYIKGTTIENYMRSRFDQEHLLQIVGVLVEQYADHYTSSFDAYRLKKWPEISQILQKKVHYINENLMAKQVYNRWYDLTGYKLDSYMISLSYYNCPDMKHSSISVYKSVLFDNDQDVNVIANDISLIYGKQVIRQTLEPLIKDMYQSYAYLEEPLTQYIGEITEELIGTYDTEITGRPHKKTHYLPPIVANYFDEYAMVDYFRHAYTWFLEDKKTEKVYIIDGELHYQDQVYDKNIINESATLYYNKYFPIVIDNGESFNILTDSMDSEPEIGPSGHKMAFISPFGFEMLADLYVYDFDTETLVTVVKSLDQTVKRVKWYDDNTLLYIAGRTHGTVTRGGSLYKLDLQSLQSTMLVEPESSQFEVSDIYYKEGWYYTMTIHDDLFMSFELVDYPFDVK